MDAREQRALAIAAMCKIDRKGGEWLVPSQTTGDRKYKVKLDGEGSCNCLDCTEGGFVCKHIRAVRIVLKRELGIDGTVTETKQVLFEEKRVYSQDWHAYNRAQACEKHRFQALLHDLCQGLPETRPNSLGRKPHRVRDAVFAMAFKVYTTFSSRRFTSDLQDAYERGYLSKKIPGLKLAQFMECKMFTPMLRVLPAGMHERSPLSCYRGGSHLEGDRDGCERTAERFGARAEAISGVAGAAGGG